MRNLIAALTFCLSVANYALCITSASTFGLQLQKRSLVTDIWKNTPKIAIWKRSVIACIKHNTLTNSCMFYYV